MQVEVDHVRSHVVLSGTGYEIRLSWSQAALLGSLLNEKSRELMPVIPGKRYEPAVER